MSEFVAEASTGPTAVEISNLTKNFGSIEVLKGINLVVKKGEVVVIVGRSGSGKSTLLRCIHLLENPTSGRVTVFGKQINIGKVDLSSFRRQIGMVFQHFELFPHRTAIENVMEGPRVVLRMKNHEAFDLASSLLAKVGLLHRAEHYPNQLSGGEKQRVAIARALALSPQIMLFDEPTSSLDPELKGEVLDAMQQLANDGMTMVIVTHEINFARRVASRIVFIDEGVVMEDGLPDETLTNPSTERFKQFLRLIFWDKD